MSALVAIYCLCHIEIWSVLGSRCWLCWRFAVAAKAIARQNGKRPEAARARQAVQHAAELWRFQQSCKFGFKKTCCWIESCSSLVRCLAALAHNFLEYLSTFPISLRSLQTNQTMKASCKVYPLRTSFLDRASNAAAFSLHQTLVLSFASGPSSLLFFLHLSSFFFWQSKFQLTGDRRNGKGFVGQGFACQRHCLFRRTFPSLLWKGSYSVWNLILWETHLFIGTCEDMWGHVYLPILHHHSMPKQFQWILNWGPLFSRRETRWGASMADAPRRGCTAPGWGAQRPSSAPSRRSFEPPSRACWARSRWCIREAQKNG